MITPNFMKWNELIISCSLTGQTFLILIRMLIRNSIFSVIKSPNLSTLMFLEKKALKAAKLGFMKKLLRLKYELHKKNA